MAQTITCPFCGHQASRQCYPEAAICQCGGTAYYLIGTPKGETIEKYNIYWRALGAHVYG